MNITERLEDSWNSIKKRTYYILGFSLLILVPYILESSGFPPVPVLSEIYAIGREVNLFSSNTFVLRILALCAVYAIFAVSWDFLSGYTGQFNFGHAIFIGLSAYIAYWVGTGFAVRDAVMPGIFGQVLVLPTGIFEIFFGPYFILDPIGALIFGGLVSSFFGLIIGIIALRLKGYYFSLLTLILPLIGTQLIVILADITGGNQGISGVPHILKVGTIAEQNRLDFYILAVILMLLSVGIMMIIAFSRIGLAFQAIREDEEAAESLGINLIFYKVLAFVISAFFAGIAGVLFSQIDPVGFVGSNLFGAGEYSFRVIIMVIIGGVGSITGGIVGAFLLTILLTLFLDAVFSSIVGLEILAFGLILILSLRYLPYGMTRAKSAQKRAIVLGILLALGWTLLPYLDIFGTLSSSITFESLLTFVSYFCLFIFTLPAIPVFIISEFLGLLFLQGILGLDISIEVLIKAKFIIYITVGIPYAYYLPKLFKKIRIKYWGVWPSVGQYEPE